MVWVGQGVFVCGGGGREMDLRVQVHVCIVVLVTFHHRIVRKPRLIKRRARSWMPIIGVK